MREFFGSEGETVHRFFLALRVSLNIPVPSQPPALPYAPGTISNQRHCFFKRFSSIFRGLPSVHTNIGQLKMRIFTKGGGVSSCGLFDLRSSSCITKTGKKFTKSVHENGEYLISQPVFFRILIDSSRRPLARRTFRPRGEHLQVAMAANKCLLVSMSYAIVPLLFRIPLDILLFQTVDLPSLAHICCPQLWQAIVYSQTVH